MEWYRQKSDDILSKLETSREEGLNNSDIESRLEKYGHNELKEETGKSFFSKIKEQFSDF